MSEEKKDIGKIMEEMLNRPLELIEENKKLKKKIDKLQKENTELKEENQRIKDINVELNTDTSAWKTTAKELEEENQELEKVIDLMAEEIAENTGSCPLDIYNWENKKYDNCNNCNDTYKECFIEYFYKEVEGENE